jgi:hypothetical protein
VPESQRPATARSREVLPLPEGPIISSGRPSVTVKCRPEINVARPSGVASETFDTWGAEGDAKLISIHDYRSEEGQI